MKQIKLRNAFCAALGVVIYSYVPTALAQTETEVPVAKSTPPTITAMQPVNPVSSKPGAPIIQSVSAQMSPVGLIVPNFISAQFHFVAPNGNAVVLHRETTATSGNNPNPMPNQAINTPTEAQKRGAIVTIGSNCDAGPSYTTYRAYVMDSDGNRSNEVQYTVHCNGG